MFVLGFLICIAAVLFSAWANSHPAIDTAFIIGTVLMLSDVIQLTNP